MLYSKRKEEYSNWIHFFRYTFSFWVSVRIFCKMKKIQIMKKKGSFIAIDKESKEEIQGIFSVEMAPIIDGTIRIPAKVTFLITDENDILNEIIVESHLSYVE